jgi:hypothetical protein
MSRIWRIFKGYLFWTYERGSFHYDVMVTVILIFIFVTPHYVDFKDQPAELPAHPMQIMVTPDGANGIIYQVDAGVVDAQDEGMVRKNFQRVLRPIAGQVTVERTEPVRDESGHIVAYRAWVKK